MFSNNLAEPPNVWQSGGTPTCAMTIYWDLQPSKNNQIVDW